jgi:hypothetical protein
MTILTVYPIGKAGRAGAPMSYETPLLERPAIDRWASGKLENGYLVRRRGDAFRGHQLWEIFGKRRHPGRGAGLGMTLYERWKAITTLGRMKTKIRPPE